MCKIMDDFTCLFIYGMCSEDSNGGTTDWNIYISFILVNLWGNHSMGFFICFCFQVMRKMGVTVFLPEVPPFPQNALQYQSERQERKIEDWDYLNLCIYVDYLLFSFLLRLFIFVIDKGIRPKLVWLLVIFVYIVHCYFVFDLWYVWVEMCICMNEYE